ncbi:StbB family protein [Paraburkholderia sp. GAS32]|uniref:StbB family protein n=1 Tax=Paraburkholderia sp. GAS32 TaxID=3035129 RepID=UPI003D1A9995
MKIAVMNKGGNVGKTVVANFLLLPRLPGATFFAMDTVNETAADLGVEGVQKIRGSQLGKVIVEMFSLDSAVLDVGASNIESLKSAMERTEDIDEEFDLFVIPVTADRKVVNESIATGAEIQDLGVNKNRIRFIPNFVDATNLDQVEDPDEERQAFDYLFKQVKDLDIGWASRKAFIHRSEVFEYLSAKKMSFDDLLGPEGAVIPDYRAMARAEPEKAAEFGKLHRWTKQAIPMRRNLDAAFRELTRGVR